MNSKHATHYLFDLGSCSYHCTFSVVRHEGSKPLNMLLERLPKASHAKCLSPTLLSTGQRLSCTMLGSYALFPVIFCRSLELYELLVFFYLGGNGSPGKWNNFPTLSYIRNGELNSKSSNFVTTHTWVFCLFLVSFLFVFPLSWYFRNKHFYFFAHLFVIADHF